MSIYKYDEELHIKSGQECLYRTGVDKGIEGGEK